MIYRKLGNSDIKVSVIAMGCMTIIGEGQDEKQSIEAIRGAIDLGINFFDTAEAYGNGASEEILGKALKGYRSKVVIASKPASKNASARLLIKSCERSLKRLDTDYIDLYQIHWPNRTVEFEETFKAMEKLKKDGKIRAIGVCNFGIRDISDALAITTSIMTNQLPYNLLFRAIEYGLREKCLDENIGIFCYSPLAQGLLTGKFYSADEVPASRARTRHFSAKRPYARHNEEGCEQETFAAINEIRKICAEMNMPMEKIALSWLIRQPGVTAVLAGARNLQQVTKNSEAAEVVLPDDVMKQLADITEGIKVKLGSNMDMWQSQSRIR